MVLDTVATSRGSIAIGILSGVTFFMSKRFIVMTTIAAIVGLSNQSYAQSPGPRFRADGRDADALGQKQGYPACQGAAYAREQRCRVGAFSHFDTLFPARTIAAPVRPTRLGRAPAEPAVSYTHLGQRLTLDDFLNSHPVTGLLIAKGDTILLERYQYGRTDKHRLTSFSMAKTVTALLIGIAVKEGAIRSIDERAEVYAPGLEGSEYGRTPIKALLQMSSGVAFSEVYGNAASDVFVLARLTLGQDPGGSLAAVRRFNVRTMEPGQRFSYSSAETVVLGLVLAGATRRSVIDYAREKLWGPMGAEADASWIVDGKQQPITYAYFNAVLRDWARLGLMLAHDGLWGGRQIVSRDWLLAATTVAAGEERLKYAWSSLNLGYGYQTWLLQGARRQFALFGVRGQRILVDPDSKLVLVHMAARAGADEGADRELFKLWEAVVSQLR